MYDILHKQNLSEEDQIKLEEILYSKITRTHKFLDFLSIVDNDFKSLLSSTDKNIPMHIHNISNSNNNDEYFKYINKYLTNNDHIDIYIR